MGRGIGLPFAFAHEGMSASDAAGWKGESGHGPRFRLRREIIPTAGSFAFSHDVSLQEIRARNLQGTENSHTGLATDRTPAGFRCFGQDTAGEYSASTFSNPGIQGPVGLG
jgi:hypothetical protein